MADLTDDLLGQVTASLAGDGISVHLPTLHNPRSLTAPMANGDWHSQLSKRFGQQRPSERHQP